VRQCERCNIKFTPKVTYQIYCSKTCREEATKEKIIERYQITRSQKRIGKRRICLGGCGKQLSIYNDLGFCNECNVHEKTVEKMLKQIKGFFDYEQDN
jgi:uncharacterized protein YmfQ (DUF2313 family)